MALEILLSIDSITSDRTEGVLLDGTVYGAPEVARTAVGVYVIGQKMNADATVDETLTLTGDTADPQTDSSWTFNIPRDGWFRFLYIAPEDYNSGTTYALYDAVQDPATSTVYRSLQAANTNNALNDTAWWEEITDPALLALNEGEANESANLASAVYSVILIPNAQYHFGTAISEAAEECCSIDCSLDDLYEYIKLAAMVDAAYIYSTRSQFAQGERLARRLEAITE